ncbi:hypothetical protein F5Y19DRAFT_418269 [Xylariaceae sp. FL1651]|nr:hypothetical protein F5Y19DRAFT_418269 [Xylariaceae sp. FL1651]
MSQYQYAVTLDTIPRLSGAQKTMSPSSSTTEQNEDWTRITDQGLRRRIQNRIAQRNYRNKLKRRLQELERRVAAQEEALVPQLVPIQMFGEGKAWFPPPSDSREQWFTPQAMPSWPSLSSKEMFLPTRRLDQSYPTMTIAEGYSSYTNTTSASHVPSVANFNEIARRQ